LYHEKVSSSRRYVLSNTSKPDVGGFRGGDEALSVVMITSETDMTERRSHIAPSPASFASDNEEINRYCRCFEKDRTVEANNPTIGARIGLVGNCLRAGGSPKL
jgi:hypothetical protein